MKTLFRQFLFTLSSLRFPFLSFCRGSISIWRKKGRANKSKREDPSSNLTYRAAVPVGTISVSMMRSNDLFTRVLHPNVVVREGQYE